MTTAMPNDFCAVQPGGVLSLSPLSQKESPVFIIQGFPEKGSIYLQDLIAELIAEHRFYLIKKGFPLGVILFLRRVLKFLQHILLLL